VADTPSQPSPEILEKLKQLREELAQKAAQQAPKDANTLAWQQSNAFKRIYPRANGGQIKATQSDPEIDALFQEPSLTMGERFRKYVAPNVIEGLNSGLNGMFPMRKLAKTAFEKGVYQPVANFVTKNANDLSDADVQGKAEEYRRLKDMELRNKYGIRQLPVEYDLSKFKRRLEPNSFPNPDNPIDVPKSLERDWTELLMQPKAKGGVIDMDRMRLELMGKSKGGSVMGVNVASDKKAGIHYADLIVDGHKTLESRNTDSLRPYVGKRVAIVRTGAGKAKAIGEVTIGEPIVANKKKFHAMREHHLVPEGSQFDIKTDTKHLYPMHDPVRYEEERDVGHGIVSRKVIHKAKGGLTIANIKDLENYILQKRGEFAAKRVQRAADEIPGLENMYTPEALQHTFERKNAGLMTMNPADFEKFAERMREDITRKDSKRKTRSDDVLTFDDYLKHLAELKGGFDEVPFLELGHRDPEYLPSIEGHEGRHRSRALSNRGVKKSLVQLMPAARMSMTMPKNNSEKLIQNLRKTLGENRFVSPEGGGLLPSDQTAGMYNWLKEKNLLEANRPQLPEIYKAGGQVTHAHHLDIEERPL